MAKLKFLSFLIAIALFAAILYFSNISRVIDVLFKSDKYFIILSLTAGIVLILLKAFRWKVFLTFIGTHVSFFLALTSFNAAMFLGNLTPGRLLEPIRGYLLKLKTKCSFSETTLLVIAERIIDILIYIVFSLVAIQMIESKLPANISRFFIIGLSFAFIISAIALFIINSKRLTLKFLLLVSKLPIIKKFKDKMPTFSKKFSSAFHKIKSVKKLGITLALTSIIWITEGFILYFALLSVGIELPVLVCTGFACLSVLIGLLSFLPGGLGSTEAVLLTLFSSLSLPIPQSTAAIIIYRFVSYLIQNLVGLFSLTQNYGLDTLSNFLSKK
jgi:uncharacterized protein (TIRG00374 family)